MQKAKNASFAGCCNQKKRISSKRKGEVKLLLQWCRLERVISYQPCGNK